MNSIKWTDEMDSLLGSKQDRLVAEILKLSPITIFKRRKLLNIQPYRDHIKLDQKTIDMLGTVSDAKISRIAGASTYLIRNRRIKLGRPPLKLGGPFPSPLRKEDRNKEIHRMRDEGWTLQAIADHFHVTRQNIHHIIQRGY